MHGKGFVEELKRILLYGEDRDTLRGHMVWGTSGTFVIKCFSTAVNLAVTLFLARLMGAKDYGAYTYAISWALLLSIPAVMGLDTLLVREVARYKAKEDWRSVRGILHWSNRVVSLATGGMTLIFVVVICLLHRRFEPSTSLWIAIPLLPLLSFIRLKQGAIQGLGYVVEAQMPFLLILPLLFLLFMGLLYVSFGLTASSVVGIRVLAAAIAFLVVTCLLSKRLPNFARRLSPSSHSREWLKSALPLVLMGTTAVINQRISTVMVGSFLGPKAAGIFDIAFKGGALVSFIAVAVNMPLAPAVAGLYAQRDTKRLQRLVTKSARVAFIGSLPIAFGLIFFGRWLLLVFGKDFIEGTIALAILTVGQLISVGMGSLSLLLNMTGHELYTVKGIGIGAMLNILFSAAFIPIWGIEGAAVATAVSTLILKVLLLVWVHKKVGLHPTVLGVAGS